MILFSLIAITAKKKKIDIIAISQEMLKVIKVFIKKTYVYMK